MKNKIKIFMMFCMAIFLMNFVSSAIYVNGTKGFKTSAFAPINTNPSGITTNSSDFWITDETNNYVVHTDSNGTQLSFENFSTSTPIPGFDFTPTGITTNKSDFWITTRNTYIYNLNRTGGNSTKGFYVPAPISADPNGITTNGSDFWFLDFTKDWVFHVDRDGNNITDGFSTLALGAGQSYGLAGWYSDEGGMTGSPTDFYITDDVDDWVYHTDGDGVNQSDGFSTSTFGSQQPWGIVRRGYDLWITDIEDDFVYQLVGEIPSSITATLNSPANATETISSSYFFSSNFSSINSNITNATLSIWYNNGTLIKSNFSIVSSSLNFTNLSLSSIPIADNLLWNYRVCGVNTTDTICSSGSLNRTFSRKLISVASTYYNNSVLETTTQTYSINVTGDSSVTSASAYFWYNGSKYTSTVTDGTSGIYKAVNSIDVPLNNYNVNKTFLWEWTFTLIGGSTVKQNTSSYQQQVNRTYLIECNSTTNLQFINFTTRSALNPFPKVNATFKMVMNHWFGSGNIKRNYSFENISELNNNWTFCGTEVDKTYQTDATIEYDANGYAQNYYFLSNASLTNDTNEVNIYLLNDSLATLTVLKVLDGAQNPKANIYINIQLYDIGTDSYQTVAMAKTSSDGSDLAYLNWYNSLYKFILIQNGEVLKITEPYKISSTPQIFTIQDAITFTFDKFKDFVYTLTYNNATENFVLTFTKPSGLVDQGCLRVTKRTAKNDTEICLVCESSASATVYCNINGYGNGTYIGTFYATGSWKLIDWITTTIGSNFAETIYNLLGNDDATAYAFLFSGVVLSMFFLSPVLAIVGLFLGILGGAALGFTILNYTEFIGIVIAGGIVIWFMKR